MRLARRDRTRWRAFGDGLRTQLWPMPAAAILAAVAIGAVMPQHDARLLRRLPATLGASLFSGGPEAARSVLQAVAGSLITVTSLTFSLTIVTLQLASGQYSPRLLRTFSRDRVVHVTLAILLATFTYALTVLRTVRTGEDAAGAFVPRLSVTTAYLLALVSVMTVAVFLAHLARKIRVESMLRDVHAEAVRAVRHILSRDGSGRPDGDAPPPDGPGIPLRAGGSGFVTAVDAKHLLAAAVDTGMIVRVDRLPGASVVAGTPVATAWPVAGRAPGDDGVLEALERAVARAVRLGFERTSEQDVAFGLRQLTDVASKALSPSVNDPTTAVHALGHSAVLLCRVAGRDLGPQVVRDDAGRVRVVLARPRFDDLLDLAVSQPRRFGAAHPEVLARLFDLLREVAWVASGDQQRRAVARQLTRLRAALAAQDFDEEEAAALRRRADLAGSALRGDWPGEP